MTCGCGTRLAAGRKGQPSAVILDARTVQSTPESDGTVRPFTGHTGPVYGCAFSPDGRYALSASDDHTLRLWEVATGALKAVW